MSLSVAAALLLAFGVILARVLHLANRRGLRRWWTSDTATMSLLTPAIVFAWAVAAGCVIHVIQAETEVGPVEGAIVVAILAGVAVAWSLLGRTLPLPSGPVLPAPVEIGGASGRTSAPTGARPPGPRRAA
jgi:hypothetical protein